MKTENSYTGRFSFKRPDTLTKEQTELLDSLFFPHSLPINKVLLKRVPQKQFRKNLYAPMENPTISDLSYTTVSDKVAANMLPNPKMSEQSRKYHEESLENKRKSSRTYNIYLDGKAAAEEMNWLLSEFTTPTPSKKMIVQEPENATPMVQAVENIETIVSVKALSPTQKSKVKALYKESGYSASEISEELGVKIDRINNYINTLN